MKRLIRKASTGSYTFSQIRELINSGMPTFDLDGEQQKRFSTALDIFETAVNEAAQATGKGLPSLEVGMVDESGLMAYYAIGSGVLTINGNDDDIIDFLNATDDYIEATGVHEYGHFLDEKLDFISQTPEFKEILKQASVNYLEGYGVSDKTNQEAEQFANAFVAWLWGSVDDAVTQFIESKI